MTAKSSIYSIGGNTDMGAFCKSGVYARKDACLTTGDLCGAWAVRLMLNVGSDRAAAKRAFEAMMQMGKIDIATIEAARRG